MGDELVEMILSKSLGYDKQIGKHADMEYRFPIVTYSMNPPPKKFGEATRSKTVDSNGLQVAIESAVYPGIVQFDVFPKKQLWIGGAMFEDERFHSTEERPPAVIASYRSKSLTGQQYQKLIDFFIDWNEHPPESSRWYVYNRNPLLTGRTDAIELGDLIAAQLQLQRPDLTRVKTPSEYIRQLRELNPERAVHNPPADPVKSPFPPFPADSPLWGDNPYDQPTHVVIGRVRELEMAAVIALQDLQVQLRVSNVNAPFDKIEMAYTQLRNLKSKRSDPLHYLEYSNKGVGSIRAFVEKYSEVVGDDDEFVDWRNAIMIVERTLEDVERLLGILGIVGFDFAAMRAISQVSFGLVAGRYALMEVLRGRYELPDDSPATVSKTELDLKELSELAEINDNLNSETAECFDLVAQYLYKPRFT